MPHVQFCLEEADITADLHASEDADEVRVWSIEDDGVLLAVAFDPDANVWQYSSSDFGPGDWITDRTFDSWQDALTFYGFKELVQ
jgi:hypothetical protein